MDSQWILVALCALFVTTFLVLITVIRIVYPTKKSLSPHCGKRIGCCSQACLDKQRSTSKEGPKS